MSKQHQTNAKADPKSPTVSHLGLVQRRGSDRNSSQSTEVTAPPPILHEALNLPIHLTNKFVIQPKLKIASTDDKYKQETVEHQVLLEKQQPKQVGLPDRLKTGIENLSGYSMGDVEVHYNSHKPARLNAHAYAQGTDIYIASGQEQCLPHEAWHVVQQKQGRVNPSMQVKDKQTINADLGLELEADKMGKLALQEQYSTQVSCNQGINRNSASQPIQLLGKKGHIAVGALAGTIIPIIGNIIGGYIGYKIWQRKQSSGEAASMRDAPKQPTLELQVPQLEERSIEELSRLKEKLESSIHTGGKKVPGEGTRTRRSEEDGPLHDKPEQSEGLKFWIEQVAKLIFSGDYLEAYNFLTDKTVCQKNGIELYLKKGHGRPLELAKGNRFDGVLNGGILTLCFEAGAEEKIATGGETSKKVLLMALEEYMHMYQAKSNRFFSEKTKTFKATGKVPDISDIRHIDSGNYDEIDIFAQLIDWGFDVEKIGYFSDYEEREAYWEWWKTQYSPEK
jgi:hypothetical protein